MDQIRGQLLRLMKRQTRSQSDVVTAVPGLTIYRRDAPCSEACTFYKPGLALIAQGRKKVDLGNESYVYDESSFLLLAVEVPTINHVLTASKEHPYLAAVLQLDMQVAREIVPEHEQRAARQDVTRRAVGTGVATRELMNTFLRLLWLVEEPQDIAFMAQLLQRELLYKLMRTTDGTGLYEAVLAGSTTNQIATAAAWIRGNYNKPLRMAELADRFNMALSTLHHNFKTVTAMSPLQYQKQLRLYEARKLLILDGRDVAGTAATVGYDSVNQFSREYKRLFGNVPKLDISSSLKLGRRSKVTKV